MKFLGKMTEAVTFFGDLDLADSVGLWWPHGGLERKTYLYMCIFELIRTPPNSNKLNTLNVIHSIYDLFIYILYIPCSTYVLGRGVRGETANIFKITRKQVRFSGECMFLVVKYFRINRSMSPEFVTDFVS